MKNLIKLALSTVLGLVVLQVNSADITDNYATGDTLTATMMNNIKSAVNDNDARITTNSQSVTTLQTDVGTLQTGVGNLQTDVVTLQTDVSDLQQSSGSIFFNEFDSRIDFQMPVLDSTNANTTIEIRLANETTTTCDVRTAFILDPWSVGQNSKSNLMILPTYIVQTLAGKIITGTFPTLTITTTIVQRSASSNVSTRDYVNVSLLRSETNAADTCNLGDVSVRGALVTYPNGTRYYVPVKDMNVD